MTLSLPLANGVPMGLTLVIGPLTSNSSAPSFCALLVITHQVLPAQAKGGRFRAFSSMGDQLPISEKTALPSSSWRSSSLVGRSFRPKVASVGFLCSRHCLNVSRDRERSAGKYLHSGSSGSAFHGFN